MPGVAKQLRQEGLHKHVVFLYDHCTTTNCRSQTNSFWTGGVLEQMATLVHESSHFVGVTDLVSKKGCRNGPCYGLGLASRLALIRQCKDRAGRTMQWCARRNADNYAYFAGFA